jgi:hypothetical protein
MQFFRRDQPQNAIAEKLKSFVGRLRIRARMGERPLEQLAVLENVTQSSLKISR